MSFPDVRGCRFLNSLFFKKGLFQSKSIPYFQVIFVLVHNLCLSNNWPVAGKRGACVLLLMSFSSVPWCYHWASHSDGKCWLISPHNPHSLVFSHVLLQKALLIFQYSPQHSLVTIGLPFSSYFIHSQNPSKNCSMSGAVLCAVEYQGTRKGQPSPYGS